MKIQVIGDGQRLLSMITSNCFTVPPMVRLASMSIHCPEISVNTFTGYKSMIVISSILPTLQP
mgnify:CR=1 FL=1